MIYKIRHKPSGRFYKGTTCVTWSKRKEPKEFLFAVFRPDGKGYTKAAWAKSALKNLIDGRNFPWSKDDLEIIVYSIQELGLLSELE